MTDQHIEAAVEAAEAEVRRAERAYAEAHTAYVTRRRYVRGDAVKGVQSRRWTDFS